MARTRQGKASTVDRALNLLQRSGVRKGVVGGSSRWLWVAVATWGLRWLRRALGSEPELVYRGELRPGETFTIDHLPETYGGGKVKVRRRR
ncbi:MAG TPA: hypothetical protein VF743_08120 [Acidimicrobiales bacterium]